MHQSAKISLWMQQLIVNRNEYFHPNSLAWISCHSHNTKLWVLAKSKEKNVKNKFQKQKSHYTLPSIMAMIPTTQCKNLTSWGLRIFRNLKDFKAKSPLQSEIIKNIADINPIVECTVWKCVPLWFTYLIIIPLSANSDPITWMIQWIQRFVCLLNCPDQTFSE